MDLRSRLKADLNKLAAQLPLGDKGIDGIVGNVSKQLSQYEGKVKKFVADLDLKSREAKQKSRKQIEDLITHIRDTRDSMEEKISQVVVTEGQKLNDRVSELLGYLVRAAAKTQAKATPKKKSPTKKRTSTKARRTRKKKLS